MPHYSKPYLPLADQLALIKNRGLLVADEAAALECLHRNGYYRLSAYWYPFREIVRGTRTDKFLSGSCFEDAVELYKFDKKLKLLLLDAIERIGIAARVEIALVLGQRDTFAHTKPALFRSRFSSPGRSGLSDYQNWINKFNEIYRKFRAEFIIHHKNQYGHSSPLPVWIAIELWDFGMLSYAYSGMQYRDQVRVAARFRILDWKLLESWLRSLNYVRNVIAHHGRLWNLGLSRSQLPQPGVVAALDHLLPLPAAHTRIYTICCILCFLTRVINPQSHWVEEAKTVFATFPIMPHASIQDMGFAADWQTQSLWQ